MTTEYNKTFPRIKDKHVKGYFYYFGGLFILVIGILSKTDNIEVYISATAILSIIGGVEFITN